MEFDELYGALIDGGYFTEAELQLVCNVAGSELETLELCVYSRYGANDMEDFLDYPQNYYTYEF